ncbi:MAG: hypothetical protein Q7U14_09525, partial [Lacisediminimonas sp.]|nr:hypothetical protein [Lacisediminimonas sp.]
LGSLAFFFGRQVWRGRPHTDPDPIDSLRALSQLHCALVSPLRNALAPGYSNLHAGGKPYRAAPGGISATCAPVQAGYRQIPDWIALI